MDFRVAAAFRHRSTENKVLTSKSMLMSFNCETQCRKTSVPNANILYILFILCLNCWLQTIMPKHVIYEMDSRLYIDNNIHRVFQIN